MLGLNNTFTYKDFDLSFYFYGQFNMLNAGSYKDTWLTGDGQMNIDRLGTGYNMPVSVKEVWSNDNPNGTRPGYFQPQSSWGIGDYYVDKTWFIRCRNITLGYTLPKIKNLDKVIQNLRVYGDVQNPFVITKYSGVDPEMDSMAAYPTQLTVSFGVDITF